MVWDQHRRPAPGNWKTLKAMILRHHHGECHLCHHQGAEQVDHIINTATWARQQLPGSPHQHHNLAPIHNAPCPTCHERCHNTKTQAEAAQGRAATPPRGKLAPEQHPGLITPSNHH